MEWYFWCVDPTGDITADYRLGEDMALEFIEAHGREPTIGAFGAFVYRDMAKADQRAHWNLINGFANMIAIVSAMAYSPEKFDALRANVALRRATEAKLMEAFLDRGR